MKNTIVSTAAPAIVAVVLAAASAVQAQNIISWNQDVYGFDNAVGGSGVPTPNTAAGVVLAYNWNDTWSENYANVNSGGVTVNNLFDNTGTATTLNLTYAAFNGASITNSQVGPDADGSYNRELLNGYLNAGPASWGPPITNSYISLSAIPYSKYDVYVYFSSDTAGRNGTISDGSTTLSFSTIGYTEVSGANAVMIQTTDTTGANPAADYAVFSGLTGSSQMIICNPTSGDNQWLGIAGFQIVAVPEPGSLALAAMGGVGMLLFGRRRVRHV